MPTDRLLKGDALVAPAGKNASLLATAGLLA
jgi:hypothetical protein